MEHSPGVFFGKLDPTPLRIEFFPFSNPPPDFRHGFNQLLSIVGPSNLVCVFHKIFLRGVFSEKWTPLPSKLIVSPFSPPPKYWRCYCQLLTIVGTSNFLHDIYELIPSTLEFISDNRAPLPSNFKSPLFPLYFLALGHSNFVRVFCGDFFRECWNKIEPYPL